MRNKLSLLAALLLSVPAQAASGDAVDVRGRYALKVVRSLVLEGHRYAGAPKREAAINGLARRLKAAGLVLERDAFAAKDPRDGAPRPMVNLVGRFRPKASCRVLLGSHYDTRHVAEEDADPAKRGKPIPGANDGTSGVAVLLSLARRFEKVVPKAIGVDVVLFDGEEMGYPGEGGYCLGSDHYARTPLLLKAPPKLGIILDMVCDERGVYRVEAHSRAAAPRVASELWEAGASVAPAAFSREPGLSIVDDHVALSQAGVPSVLVIGFNYPEWHTHADTPDKCSARRLGEVEETLAVFLKERAAALAGCAP